MRGRRHGESLFHWGYCSRFVVSTGHPRREIDEFAKLASASGESLQRANQTPVVVNNSGSVQRFMIVVAATLILAAGGCNGGDEPGASVLPVSILPEPPFSYRGKIGRAWGGDNFEVIADNKVHFAWIAGISTPAYGQFGHQLAFERLKELTSNHQVEISVLKRDQWKREVCELRILSQQGDIDLATTLLKEGLAWSSSNDGSNAERYRELEGQAREKKLGIWSQPNPIPPWEFWEKKNEQLDKKLKRGE